MRKSLLSFVLFAISSVGAGEPLPIDPLWKSAEFRKAFTASFGVDARIEPRLTTGEKAVLDEVAEAMAEDDRHAALDALSNSSLLEDSPALLFTLGNLSFEEAKLEDAMENFQAAVELYPNFRDAHRNLAVALVQGGDFEKAEPHLRRAIELGAGDGVTFGLLGYCHATAGRHQAALQGYRRAQLTMPEETQWQVGEVDALTALGEDRAAQSLFVGLLQKHPEDAGLWLRQADVWIRSAQPEEAIANLEFVRRMGKLKARQLTLLGHLYCQAGMADHALQCYQHTYSLAIENDDENGALNDVVDGLELLCRYRQFERTKDLNEKIYFASTGEGKLGERTLRIRALIELQSEGGDETRGVELIEEVIDSNPLDGEALLVFAEYRARTGASDEAMMLLEQAAKVDATRAEALFRHGRLLVEAREYAAGLKLIEQSLALEPRQGLAEYLAAVRRFAESDER